MKQRLRSLMTAFTALAPRERMLVSAVGVLLALIVVWFAGVQPFLALGERAAGRVVQAEQQLEVMKRLRREFDEVNQRLVAVEGRIRSGDQGNLRTTLEDLARRAEVKIDSMEPQASPASERYRETKVEVVLKQVSLPHTVRYLHEIESMEQLLSVKALRIRTRPEDSALLDVTFTVSSFERL
jgi:type II secretory pathway component PulM